MRSPPAARRARRCRRADRSARSQPVGASTGQSGRRPPRSSRSTLPSGGVEHGRARDRRVAAGRPVEAGVEPQRLAAPAAPSAGRTARPTPSPSPRRSPGSRDWHSGNGCRAACAESKAAGLASACCSVAPSGIAQYSISSLSDERCESSSRSVIGRSGKAGLRSRPAEIVGDVAVEIEPALLDQPHHPERHDQLGDRGDPRRIVDGQPPPARPVGEARGAGGGDPRSRRRSPRHKRARGDVGAGMVAQPAGRERQDDQVSRLV